MSGLDEAGWHSFDAEITYAFVEGGPATIALSQNGRSAYGHRLMAPGDSLKIGPGVLRTLSCLGAYTLLQLTLEPDVALTDRQLAPDDWVPGPGGRPQW